MFDFKEFFETCKEVDPTHTIPLLYQGMKKTVTAWNEYVSAVELGIVQPYADVISDTESHDSFLILTDIESGEVVGIREYGRYDICPSDFLFITPYLPIHVPMEPLTVPKLRRYIVGALDLFEKECGQMAGQKPLFLVKHLAKNNYLTWSLKDAEYVLIYDYKSYRNTFNIFTLTGPQPAPEEYTVTPPSDELIERLGLTLHSRLWNNKTVWDRWDVQPVRKEIDFPKTIDGHLIETYRDAVAVLNYCRSKPTGFDQDVASLERQVDMVESYIRMNAPDVILLRAFDILKKKKDRLVDHL